MSTIMADKTSTLYMTSPTRKVLVETMKIKSEYIGQEDVEAVQRVCNIVGKRSARLSAVAVAAVLQHSFESKVETTNVGVDGSVVEFLPHFIHW
jgi:hexokinase